MPRDFAPLQSSTAPHGSRRLWRRYLREARRPLHSLLFLLPWVVTYELGAWSLAQGNDAGRELIAHGMIQSLLAWFGVVGFWVPGVALVGALVVWHVLRGDRWRIQLWVLPGMLGEGIVLAVPLLVLSGLYVPASAAGTAGLRTQVLLALGAGIYEELVFRLLLIGALAWLLARLAKLRGTAGLAVAAGLAAVAFALCHFRPVGAEVFAWRAFGFKFVAGLYLGLIFLGRGVGISSGAHAAYNVLLVWFRSAAG